MEIIQNLYLRQNGRMQITTTKTPDSIRQGSWRAIFLDHENLQELPLDPPLYTGPASRSMPRAISKSSLPKSSPAILTPLHLFVRAFQICVGKENFENNWYSSDWDLASAVGKAMLLKGGFCRSCGLYINVEGRLQDIYYIIYLYWNVYPLALDGDWKPTR